ncbi:MAG: nicotinate (nicotinamide) nucleotide adenylyltransferase [Phycisphaerae bacterium]|jgi:nicotinate-nucleotide adenylyltransferase|nr:nicotinate (nicotinamide) nucleotide adenylyltransferase [Phycisphaerae bacterium]MBT5409474.1 nicotinate (nicotinamide) nucleotide adenylyltransferase [Phycisphaerae bacterium]|tara:strand:+ start:1950 stop:2498 length:549 start_codon:yes stop_codon:yes gene_type:complete
MCNVLIYGGSFDPPHLGHVRVPKEAMDFLSFDKVVFVPAFQSPLKDRIPTASSHRIAMLNLAVQGLEWAEISEMEIEREGTSFTIDSIEALLGTYNSIRLLIGADQWEQFERWHRWEDITRLAKPAIMPRVGYNSPVEHTLPIAPLTCASTEIRECIASRNDPNAFLHPEVAKYIAEHNLYL